MTIAKTTSITAAILAAGLIAAAPAIAEDGGLYTGADPGTQLRTELPIAVHQELGAAQMRVTVTPTLSVGTTTIATLPTLTVDATPYTQMTLTIPQDVVAAAQAAGIAQGRRAATLTFLSETAEPSSWTQSNTTTLALDGGDRIPGRIRLAAPSNKRGLPSGGLSYTLPGTWRSVENSVVPLYTVPLNAANCSMTTARYAYTIRAHNLKTAVRNQLLRVAVIRTIDGPQPQAFGTVPALTPTRVRAATAAPLGGDRYAVLVMTGELGAGCAPTKANIDAAADQLARVTKTVRSAR